MSTIHRFSLPRGKLLVVFLSLVGLANLRKFLDGRNNGMERRGPTLRMVPEHNGTGKLRPNPPTVLMYVDTPVPRYYQKDYLELMTRLPFSKRWDEARTVILPTMQLFWPHAHLVVVLDAETDSAVAPQITKKVAEEFPGVKARGAVMKDYPTVLGTPGYGGWQRGQLDMMFADTVVKAKYVGLCDSDTFFNTLVAPNGVFTKDGRPIVVAGIARHEPAWTQVVLNTRHMLKKDYVVSCMSHFPVTLATAHIKEMRAYVERVHGKPFLEVYKEVVVKGLYCHFSIMCNYVWYFHHKEYDWHYHNYFKNRPGWDQPVEGQTNNFSFLTEKNTHPIARISAHFAHTNLVAKFDMPYGEEYESQGITGHIDSFNTDLAAPWLINGFCYAATAQCAQTARPECKQVSKACALVNFDKNTLQMLMFRFEILQTWEWDTRCIDAQRAYYRTLEDYTYWIPYGMKVLNSSRNKAPAFAQFMSHL